MWLFITQFQSTSDTHQIYESRIRTFFCVCFVCFSNPIFSPWSFMCGKLALEVPLHLGGWPMEAPLKHISPPPCYPVVSTVVSGILFASFFTAKCFSKVCSFLYGVIVVQKSSSRARKYTFYEWGYYFLLWLSWTYSVWLTCITSFQYLSIHAMWASISPC